MRRKKKEASKVKQTNKAKQHSTPKAVTCTCTVLLCVVVCLTLLASFFLPSHLSLKTCTVLDISVLVTIIGDNGKMEPLERERTSSVSDEYLR